MSAIVGAQFQAAVQHPTEEAKTIAAELKKWASGWEFDYCMATAQKILEMNFFSQKYVGSIELQTPEDCSNCLEPMLCEQLSRIYYLGLATCDFINAQGDSRSQFVGHYFALIQYWSKEEQTHFFKVVQSFRLEYPVSEDLEKNEYAYMNREQLQAKVIKPFFALAQAEVWNQQEIDHLTSICGIELIGLRGMGPIKRCLEAIVGYTSPVPAAQLKFIATPRFCWPRKKWESSWKEEDVETRIDSLWSELTNEKDHLFSPGVPSLLVDSKMALVLMDSSTLDKGDGYDIAQGGYWSLRTIEKGTPQAEILRVVSERRPLLAEFGSGLVELRVKDADGKSLIIERKYPHTLEQWGKLYQEREWGNPNFALTLVQNTLLDLHHAASIDEFMKSLCDYRNLKEAKKPLFWHGNINPQTIACEPMHYDRELGQYNPQFRLVGFDMSQVAETGPWAPPESLKRSEPESLFHQMSPDEFCSRYGRKADIWAFGLLIVTAALGGFHNELTKQGVYVPKLSCIANKLMDGTSLASLKQEEISQELNEIIGQMDGSNDPVVTAKREWLQLACKLLIVDPDMRPSLDKISKEK